MKPSSSTPHGIDRAGWERRFHARIAERAVDPEDKKLSPAAAAEISTEELESWSVDCDDWPTTTPEDAADEQMTNWMDDQIP